MQNSDFGMWNDQKSKAEFDKNANSAFHIPNSAFEKMTLAMLVAGTFLRIAVWLQQRSIFIDEANLIRNWLERSPSEMFRPLGYEQYCPPLFSLFSKGAIAVFGVSELSVRALPLASGAAMVWVFWLVARRFFSPLATLFSIAFLSSGHLFLQYSSECKQYSTDGLVAMLLVFFALKTSEKGLNRAKGLAWAVGGAAAIWLSMPSVFVLTGVGFFFLNLQKNKRIGSEKKGSTVKILRITKALPLGEGLGGAVLFWLLNFGAYFFKILRSDASSVYIQNGHRDFFLAFPPRNLAELARLGQQIQDIVSMSVGQTAVALVVAAVGFAVGLQRFWKTDRAVFWLFLMPILATLGASAFHFYSIIGRLILFLIPFFQLLIFAGLDVIFQFKKNETSIEKADEYSPENLKSKRQKVIVEISKWVLLGFVLMAFSVYEHFEYFTKPLRDEHPEISKIMRFLKTETQKDEAVFADFDAAPAARFYAEHRSEPIELQNLTLKNYVCCDGDQREKAIRAIRKSGFRKIWLVWAHSGRPDYLDFFVKKDSATVVREQFFERSAAILLQF